MRVFVTGGSGFVGGHVIERLAKDHEVFAMARTGESAEIVRRFGAEPVRAALGAVKKEDVARMDAVVHCAAFAEEWGTRAQFFSANVDGTVQLADVAREAGVKRFVFCSTEATLFDGHDLIDVDETTPYPSRHRYLYSESKAEAEKRVLAACTSSFATISVRPRLVWGPRDASVLPAIVKMAKAGSFAWIDGGRHLTSSTHVHNAADGLALALERGRPGEIYFVTDEEKRTMRELLTSLAATQGVDLSKSASVPGWLARPMASLIEGSYRLFGVKRQPPMTAFAVAMMSRSVTIRIDKARNELGYVPRVGWQDGLAALRVAK
jgi:nucleoside-diphosphate-sugar epimerase